MRKLTPLILLLVIFLSGTATAQMLEEVDMSTPGNLKNTYLTGINNKGFISGYYTSGGSNYGFIITPEGTRLIVNPLSLSATDTRVESINDNNVGLVVATVGGTTVQYKCYVDAATDTITGFLQINNVQQTSASPYDINNYNDISGWYQAAQRWLYVQHDSIVPGGNFAWDAARYQTAGPVYYNTFGTGINDANDVAGYYIDGSLYNPFKYDNLSGTFNVLTYGAFKIKPWDITNNNWIAGEYQQTNGFWMGFYAYVGTGNITQWHSLDNIFASNTIQSVVNGINNNQDAAGAFLHPDGHWVGFIYHPNISEYRIPGFSYYTGTWRQLNNNAGVPNSVWPQSYWNNFNYYSVDPYAYNDSAVIDQFALNTYNNFYLSQRYINSQSPCWRGFISEVDPLHSGQSSNYYEREYYKNISKHYFVSKYNTKCNGPGGYNGHCYGFTFTQLLHHFNDALFSQWYGYPPGTDISTITNTDTNALKTMSMMYFKQNDIPTIQKYGISQRYKKSNWGGLYRLKNTYQLPFAESNPRGVYIGFDIPSGSGWHSLMPYKIRTPRTLPFDYPTMKYDTMFIHDSNNPNDSSQYFFVHSIMYDIVYDSVYNNTYSVVPNRMAGLSFNEMSIKENYPIQYSNIKSTSSNTNQKHLRFALQSNVYYNITGNTTTQASNDGSGYSNNDENDFLLEQLKTTQATEPSQFVMDTNNTAKYNTYNYTDGSMVWTQTNTLRSLCLSRTTGLSEVDNGMMKNRLIAYGNPDNVTKYLNASMTEMTEDLSQGSSILAAGICAAPGDSILIENTPAYSLKITKLVGTSDCTYDLTIFAAYNGDTVKEFHAPIQLTGATSHTIDPYFAGNDGQQIAVIIDNGLDGITDDTLFVAGWPVSMENLIHKEGIRVYPNPVHDELNIDFAVAGKYNITITDIVGRVLDSKQVSMSSGKAKLPMGQYPAGVYVIQITDEKGSLITKDKIIKQ